MKQLKVKAPGRINLIGEHLDYNHGIVLPAAIDRFFEFELLETPGTTILIEALDLNEKWEFSWFDLNDSITSGWKNYVKGVLLLMDLESHLQKGLCIRFRSNIPIGAGLSSSAALCCGLAFGLNAFYTLGKTRFELALIAQKTEHQFAGVNCGLMDQVASIFGQKQHLIAFDCWSNEISAFQLPLVGVRLFLLDSGVKHELASSAYNERRESMEHAWSVAKQLFPNLLNWRSVTAAQLEQLLKELDTLTQKRVTYVWQEMQRVEAVQRLSEEMNEERLGLLLNQTHEGLRDLYEVSCQEVDYLQRALCELPSVLGARMMGGGFGGCLLVLAKDEPLQLESVIAAYYQLYQKQAQSYFIEISDGVRLF